MLLPFVFRTVKEIGLGEVIDHIPVSVDKNMVTLFVIKGKPRSIWGLDEGIFCSVNHMDPSHINVMSEKKFKEL